MVQGFVDLQNIRSTAGAESYRIVQRDRFGSATTLGSLVGAGIVDQDQPHQSGGNSEEMCAIFPLNGLRLSQKANAGLVDQRGGLEGLVWAATP